MDTFLVLGTNSRLAFALKRVLPRETIYLDKSQCDIRSEKDLQYIFNQYNFNYIINCVAITDINYCEKNQKECFDVNTIGVIKLGELCQKYNKKLIHISSNYAINPTNVYGASKYLSEQLLDKTATIIRTSFYDDKTYVINSLLLDKPIESYENMFFNPISVNRLAKEILSNKNKSGLINIFSSKKISYYEFAQKVCQTFNVSNSLVKKTKFVNSTPPMRPLNAYVKSDVQVDINEDLHLFRSYLTS